ncbi:MAG: hypothetical protein WCF36_21645 [Candidatus Nanopelagicales bacterium]
MTRTPPTLPGAGPTLAEDLTIWAHDPVWADLVAVFGGDPCELPTDTSDRLAWLDRFSDRWDARKGVLERDETGNLPLGPAQEAAVRVAADRLGCGPHSCHGSWSMTMSWHSVA